MAVQDKGPGFLTVSLIFTLLAALTVLLRVYVRVWIKRAVGWDDGMIILSTIFAVIGTVFNVMQVRAGFGRHMRTLSHEQRIETLKWNWLASPMLVFSLATSKISISLLLLRVLERTNAKRRRWFLYGLIALIIIIATPAAAYCVGQCRPVRKLWDPSAPGRCYDHTIFIKIGYVHGATNIFFDFALALFPITFIKDLNLEARKRVILFILMSFGVVCGVLALARTILTSSLHSQGDYTYDIVNTGFLAHIEQNISIIVACIPTLRPIAVRLTGKAKVRLSDRKRTRKNPTGSQIENADFDTSVGLASMPRAAYPKAPVLPPQYRTLPMEWNYSSETRLVGASRKATTHKSSTQAS